jgi:hypothetical protein
MTTDPERVDAWLHEARNAVNSALMCSSVAERLLDQGRSAEAQRFCTDAREACERLRLLMEECPVARRDP